MKFAAIIARKVGGGVVGGKVSLSVAELLPKIEEIRAAGKIGKTLIDRVWVATDAGVVKELKVKE